VCVCVCVCDCVCACARVHVRVSLNHVVFASGVEFHGFKVCLANNPKVNTLEDRERNSDV